VRTDADTVAVTTEAQSRGLTVHLQLLDVRDVTSINEAVSRIFATHGCIDVLVNNASLGFARAAFDVTEADWDEMMAVNLRGVFFMSQAAARTMAGSGRVVASSTSVRRAALSVCPTRPCIAPARAA
jgi:NAD(P)-dependent dehydrogenase (short-subunit alcohol dehydrogenase family)